MIKYALFGILLFLSILLIRKGLASQIEIGARYHFQTHSNEFSFTVITAKGPIVELMKTAFEEYKDTTGQDLVLYRIFETDWRNYNKWIDYCLHEKYHFPYLEKIN